jgi:hypothetical protein
VKERAHFIVVGSDDPAEVERRLRAVLPAHRGETVDVEVDSAYRHLIERDFAFRHLRLRVVGDGHEMEQHHRVTVTNASPAQLAAQPVAAVYALRWEIGPLFREPERESAASGTSARRTAARAKRGSAAGAAR